VELAVARFIAPTVEPGAVLESRLRLPGARTPAPPEGNGSAGLASILGARVGHLEDAFNCDAHYKLHNVSEVLAIEAPHFSGDSAWLNVERVRYPSTDGRSMPVLEGQVYILRRHGDQWTVVGLGTHSIS
jgi:hypothetical protein